MARWQFFANSQMGFQISAKWKGLGRHERIFSLTPNMKHGAWSLENTTNRLSGVNTEATSGANFF